MDESGVSMKIMEAVDRWEQSNLRWWHWPVRRALTMAFMCGMQEGAAAMAQIALEEHSLGGCNDGKVCSCKDEAQNNGTDGDRGSNISAG